LFETLFTVANLLEHGDIDLPGRIEAHIGRVLVTPALHRRHHTRTRPARDTNFGTIFSLWDRLLGTLTPNASTNPVETGLPGLARVSLTVALRLPIPRAGLAGWRRRVA